MFFKNPLDILILLPSALHSSLPARSVSAVFNSFVTPPLDCSPPGSSVHGILQARILEWVAVGSHRGLLKKMLSFLTCFTATF